MFNILKKKRIAKNGKIKNTKWCCQRSEYPKPDKTFGKRRNEIKQKTNEKSLTIFLMD